MTSWRCSREWSTCQIQMNWRKLVQGLPTLLTPQLSAMLLAALTGPTLQLSLLLRTGRIISTRSYSLTPTSSHQWPQRPLSICLCWVSGAVHDARVLRWSTIYVQHLYPPPGWCIIGDGGYPWLSAPICLMTPFREPVQNIVQARYNRKLSKARCIVERSIGMMKTRWRSIFLKAPEVKAEMHCTQLLFKLKSENEMKKKKFTFVQNFCS